MNEENRLILQGLSFLISELEPKSIDGMMFKKLWLGRVKKLNNPTKEPTIAEKTEFALGKDGEV